MPKRLAGLVDGQARRPGSRWLEERETTDGSTARSSKRLLRKSHAVGHQRSKNSLTHEQGGLVDHNSRFEEVFLNTKYVETSVESPS